MTDDRACLRLHPDDDLIVALVDRPGVPAKHKFAARDLTDGQSVRMYGVVVGRAVGPIPAGACITPRNLTHAVGPVQLDSVGRPWTPPKVDEFRAATFGGYRRSDGRVGTANHWLVVPLVFCENRNLDVMRRALHEELGYSDLGPYRRMVRQLMHAAPTDAGAANPRFFRHVDGVKFLFHTLGCGGTRQDADTLCALLAAYIDHPNVAGATVLSLGCQNAQVDLLHQHLRRRNPAFDKPLLVFDQQAIGRESELMSRAIERTFHGLEQADRCRRVDSPLDKLVVGVKCGGSDGFSGLSANPAVGHAADLLVALGGAAILAEFPELCGTEQELVRRCVDRQTAEKFLGLMRDYQAMARAVGSGMENNPSPGNIADGLITDAMKSAGAVRKGGTSPVVAALDYPEPVRGPGLHLLCTPGNDVEATTGKVAAGATVLLFTTGLGTPTGNPIVPTLKISTHTALAQRMPDLIDFDAGPILTGQRTIEQVGADLLALTIRTAGGDYVPHAVRLGQDDFIPWKRGVSL
jgi:altronate hydrolase